MDTASLHQVGTLLSSPFCLFLSVLLSPNQDPSTKLNGRDIAPRQRVSTASMHQAGTDVLILEHMRLSSIYMFPGACVTHAERETKINVSKAVGIFPDPDYPLVQPTQAREDKTFCPQPDGLDREQSSGFLFLFHIFTAQAHVDPSTVNPPLRRSTQVGTFVIRNGFCLQFGSYISHNFWGLELLPVFAGLP